MAAPEVELEDAVFTRGGRTSYARPTSIHHWQLRDLISPGPSEAEFYCVQGQAVLLHNAKSRQSKVVSSLDFSPNSMTCRHGFMAAGGLHGELEVRSLSTGQACFRGAVGTTVNNALHIAATPDGDVRLFVCCNDSSIKVFHLPSMESVTTIRCPCPINYAALSPDGSLLAAVGDCDPTLVFAAAPGGYTLLTSFTQAADVGMCCAWSAHGGLAASVHQDGTVAVWEPRGGACVARAVLPSAARCCKFAAAPLDLLAVSEHERRANLLDARAWGRRQVLELGGGGGGSPAGGRAGSPGGGDISGIAFTPSGQRLWVGGEDACCSYDIDSLRRRTFAVAAVV